MTSIGEKLYLALPPLRNLAATIKGAVANRERYGGNYWAAVESVCARESWSAQEMAGYQLDRLRHILEISFRHVPYYRDLFLRLGLTPGAIRRVEDLARLPILEKDPVRAAPLQFVDERLNPRKLLTETTTGTTGTPIRVLMTPHALREHYAFFEVRCRRAAGFVYGKHPFVSFGVRRVVARRRTRPPFWCYNRAGRQLYMSVYHLAPQYLRDYCRELKRRPYRALMGFPSAITAVAQYMLAEGIRDIHIPIAITSGETLHAHQRAAIEEAFGCRVYDQYGCSEMAVFAAEGPCGRMHISPDYGLVEIVDEEGRPLPAGRTGHVVCTGLINDAQILLRYRVGDIAAIDPRPCACGSAFPAFQSVDGRAANAILLPDGRKLFRMAAIDAEIPCIRQYQIVQEQMDVFTLYVVTAEGFTDREERLVRANLAANVGPASITVRRVEQIAQGPGGKYASVVSKLCAAGRAAAH